MNISPEFLRQRFAYNPISGHITHKTKNPQFNLKKAGTKNRYGYIVIRIKYQGVLHHISAHRLAWTLTHGEIPPHKEIDHINGIRFDNSLSNLRIVTHSENSKNQRPHRNLSTGHIGVIFDKKTSAWLAHIRVNGERIHLGTYHTLHAARKAREAANAKYGFHPNHGKPALAA